MTTSFGEKLKQARTAKKLKQSELAKQLGVTNTTVSNWENNVSRPDLEMLSYICGILEVKVSYFLETKVPDNEISVSEFEMIKKYRSLDSTGKNCIDFILNIEIERTVNLEEMREAQKKRILTYEKALKEMHGNKSPHAHLDISSESVITYDANAAHERPDIDVTDEMRKHDDEIMNNDSE